MKLKFRYFCRGKKKNRDWYIPWLVGPRPDWFPIAMLSCFFSKRGRNSRCFKTESTCVALCAQRNDANIDDSFNIVNACSLRVHLYFASSGPFSTRLLLTGCYWLKWRPKTVKLVKRVDPNNFTTKSSTKQIERKADWQRHNARQSSKKSQ